MINTKLLILFTATVLILLLISLACISCNIIDAGKEAVISDGEVIEEITEFEEVEEITKVKLWISEAVPDSISDEVEYELGRIFDEVIVVYEKEDSDIWIEAGSSRSDLKISYVLVPVVSFFRNYDEISYEDIRMFWTGDSEALDYLSIDGSKPELLITEEVYKVLEKILGPGGNDNIKIVYSWQIPTDIENDNSFSIVPFEDIYKEYKVLNIDGMSVLDKNLDVVNYPMAAGISVKSNDPELAGIIAEGFSNTFITNRDTEELTSVIMTGVTAIVRQVARKIESDGVLSPGEEIAEVLKDADITHISNELPFVEDCNGPIPRAWFFAAVPNTWNCLDM